MLLVVDFLFMHIGPGDIWFPNSSPAINSRFMKTWGFFWALSFLDLLFILYKCLSSLYQSEPKQV